VYVDQGDRTSEVNGVAAHLRTCHEPLDRVHGNVVVVRNAEPPLLAAMPELVPAVDLTLSAAELADAVVHFRFRGAGSRCAIARLARTTWPRRSRATYA
jgi:hypothetical protein